MKKRTLAICAGIAAVNLSIALSACQSGASGQDTPGNQETLNAQEEAENKAEPEDNTAKTDNEEYKMTAVYLTDEEGNSLFVELKTEMPFYSTIPEGELYDEEGKKISPEDLKNGDVLEITGNGMIAESYPAQYHGIYKMLRIEKENKEYADKYGELLEQFIVKEDPKEVPFLDVSYSQPEALVTAVAETGGYTWSYENDKGETETITVDSSHVLEWKWQENSEMKISEDTEMELLFSKKPEEIQVLRWPEAEKRDMDEPRKEESLPEGEKVQVTENPEENPKITAEPGFVYLVEASWENGEAQYGFCTASIK